MCGEKRRANPTCNAASSVVLWCAVAAAPAAATSSDTCASCDCVCSDMVQTVLSLRAAIQNTASRCTRMWRRRHLLQQRHSDFVIAGRLEEQSALGEGGGSTWQATTTGSAVERAAEGCT